MKAKKMRDFSTDELQQEHDRLLSEHFHARVKHTLGQLENPLQLRAMRRDIARAKTLLLEQGVEIDTTYRRRQTASGAKGKKGKKKSRSQAAASE